MKKSPAIMKYLLLIFINTCPFVLSVLFFHIGATDDIFLSIHGIAGLIILNYSVIGKTLHYILFQLYLVICEISSGWIETYLYYHNISNDWPTPVIGQLVTIVSAAIIIIATIVTGIFKINHNRKLYN